MSPTCTFCRIARGEVAAELVLDTPEVLAFLDHRPLFPGHVLVVPRAHHETLTDLPVADVAPLFATVQRVAAAVVASLGCAGTFVAMNNKVSQSVAHLHVHVVPRNPKDGLRGFFWPRTRYESPAAMTAMGAAIRVVLETRL